jgi:hypothetical protein
MREHPGRLVCRAQDAGVLRGDIAATDMLVLTMAARSASAVLFTCCGQFGGPAGSGRTVETWSAIGTSASDVDNSENARAGPTGQAQ